MKCHRMLSKFSSKLLVHVALVLAFVLGYWSGFLLNEDFCYESCCRQRLKTFQEKREKLELFDKKTTFLVVMIMTGPGNREQRRAMRETWLQLAQDRPILHYFIIGTADLDQSRLKGLQEEYKHYGDLVLLRSHNDSYRQLSSKLLSSLRWLQRNINFKFLLKADDDTFARLDLIYSRLLNQPPRKFYWGYFDGRARVHRKGKWAEKEWNLCDHYLPHALGGGYVLSSDLVDYVANNAALLKAYRSEDVSLGAWLAPLDIERRHDIDFDTEYMSRGCLNSYLVTHKQSSKQMREKHRNLQRHRVICPSQFETRSPYNYNWAVPPSKCCIPGFNLSETRMHISPIS
ncbi:B3GALT6 [Cordylochernes scorpioides]|uniref:Hexosyltransferase n=1 Tax=Cordylochernes scorpioides TaxID=51811 RepID=A0ABY6LLC3_9ARAC|nr:B3GALT6 [Cordylochernes scorpioides]